MKTKKEIKDEIKGQELAEINVFIRACDCMGGDWRSAIRTFDSDMLELTAGAMEDIENEISRELFKRIAGE